MNIRVALLALTVFTTIGCVMQSSVDDLTHLQNESAFSFLTDLNSWRELSFPDTIQTHVSTTPCEQGFIDGKLWYDCTLTLVFSPVLSCDMENLPPYACGWKEGERHAYEFHFMQRKKDDTERYSASQFRRLMLLAQGINPDISLPPEIRQVLPIVNTQYEPQNQVKEDLEVQRSNDWPDESIEDPTIQEHLPVNSLPATD